MRFREQIGDRRNQTGDAIHPSHDVIFRVGDEEMPPAIDRETLRLIQARLRGRPAVTGKSGDASTGPRRKSPRCKESRHARISPQFKLRRIASPISVVPTTLVPGLWMSLVRYPISRVFTIACSIASASFSSLNA